MIPLKERTPIGYIAICIKPDDMYQKGQFVSDQLKPTDDREDALIWKNPKIGSDNFKKLPIYMDNEALTRSIIDLGL